MAAGRDNKIKFQQRYSPPEYNTAEHTMTDNGKYNGKSFFHVLASFRLRVVFVSVWVF